MNMGGEAINILLYDTVLIKLQRHLELGKFMPISSLAHSKGHPDTHQVVGGRPSGSNCTIN